MTYLLVVDYFSRYPEITKLTNTTSKCVIAALRPIFARHGTEFFWCGLSPAQLLMGRRIRSTLPQVLDNLLPKWPYLKTFEEQEKAYKRNQKKNYDKRHRTRSMLDIPDDHPVWVSTDGQLQQGILPSSRSYLVDIPNGRVRRNHQHLIPMTENSSTSQPPQRNPNITSSNAQVTRTSPVRTKSQTSTRIVPPDRLTYWEREMWTNDWLAHT